MGSAAPALEPTEILGADFGVVGADELAAMTDRQLLEAVYRQQCQLTAAAAMIMQIGAALQEGGPAALVAVLKGVMSSRG